MDIVSLPFSLPLASIASAFALSNFAGQVIVIILYAASIFGWTLLITKMIELRNARVSSRRFLLAYRKEVHPVGLFMKRQRFESSPLYWIYDRACRSLGGQLQFSRGGDAGDDLFVGGAALEGKRLEDLQINVVKNAGEEMMAEQTLRLERNMGMIALITTSAPLLGLLGTVWGAMEAFEQAATTGAAMLSQVAPGISGALLTTVIGLLVAIPSGIGYNILVEQVRRLNLDMENFSQDFMLTVERSYKERR